MNKLRYKSVAAQGGFTLIELIVVIVILGIMAATALPKFADMGAQARAAKVQAAAGSMKSALAIAHAAYLAGGSNNSVTIEGTGYTLTNGYPAVTDIAALSGITATDYSISSGAISADSTHATNCTATYTAATISGGVVTPASVAVSTSAC